MGRVGWRIPRLWAKQGKKSLIFGAGTQFYVQMLFFWRAAGFPWPLAPGHCRRHRRRHRKLSPPTKLRGRFASPRHSGRWGGPDSRRRRLCRGEHACELPAARAEGAASVSVHRRPTPNRCQGHRANVRSEPTTEQSAGRCAQHFTTEVRAMQLAAFSGKQAWCQPIRAIVVFAF